MRAVSEGPVPHLARSATCCAACASQDDALEIACTLETGDFKARVADFRGLASRSLLRSERTPLTLHLIYDLQALKEVEDLVAKESACCSFLDFDVTQDAAGAHLSIVAPIEALAAADVLFAHFAPGPARQTA